MKAALLENIKVFLNSAELVYNTKDFTSATILYFKTLFVAYDLIIFERKKFTPKDHTERFRIFKKYFSEEYLFLDKYFSVYQDTYSVRIDKDICEEIRIYVKEYINKKFNI